MLSVGRVVLIALALMAIAAPSAYADARRHPLAPTDESMVAAIRWHRPTSRDKPSKEGSANDEAQPATAVTSSQSST